MRRLAVRLVILAVVFAGSSIVRMLDSTPTSTSQVTANVNAAAPTPYVWPTSIPAQAPPPRPTATSAPAISYRGSRCIEWTQVRSSHLDSRICVYGRIYTYGPYSNQWDTIQFFPSANSLRVTDFNYHYTEPLDPGDCAIIYGRICDYGPYLIIAPDKDADDAVRTGPGNLCG